MTQVLGQDDRMLPCQPWRCETAGKRLALWLFDLNCALEIATVPGLVARSPISHRKEIHDPRNYRR